MSSSDSSSAESRLATAKTVLTTAASVAATAMLARSLVQDYLPDEVHNYISYGFRCIFGYFSSQMTIIIEEFEGFAHNEVFEAAEAYLATKISPSNKRIKVSKHEKENNYNVTVERDEEVSDTYNGVKFQWILHCRHVESKHFHNPRDLNSTLRSEVRSFELNFHKKYKDVALESYLPFMVKRATLMKQEKKTLKIFTLSPENMYGNYSDAWTSVTLDHPSTFKTLAMDSDVKRNVMDDLDQFVQRRDYYKRVGKAWKRGYLLYGPPGTGKSSLIAAMANHLNFDIYDLELTAVNNNSELRRLLIATANRSILIVEDIDCSLELKDRTGDEPPREADDMEDPRYKKVTLSGMLNFIDGLWSSCGDERIIIFTTNYKEKLDAALLRPGRMDMHIHMSYCTPSTFKALASNYLEIKEHHLFSKIEEGIEATEVTPAEVAEQLMRNDTVDKVLEGLIEFLKVKKIENEQDKAKKEKQELENKKNITKGKDSVVKKTEEVDEQLVRNDRVDKVLEGLVELLKVKKMENDQDKAKHEEVKEQQH
ncbi:LOW QUALITY PROTEIN: protein HYPER-SENSITIVITY-RELATED 4 [Capsella rubella]|uniref:LOW QUALITY PROTEIN: protein HYPER-SENSITIVITY-RELATED 4 n=1 Tax=Capsella rubella TaxID=81985 RepID=UPI000CD5BC88|nr:LOW QUALITY PROTEIN: protein HYPER-SENSITIVITY-RELATED 4 [Capsella rubella]